ncbi:MAG: DUF116 domain-containing protein [Pseudomonadota bacterium]
MSEEKSQKVLFIGLLLTTCALFFCLAGLLWWVPYVGLSNIHKTLPLVLAVLLGTFVTVATGGILSLILTLISKKDFLLSKRLRGIVIKIIFPLIVAVGRLFGISKRRIQHAFVEVNNNLVMAQAGHIKPEKLLLLMPHCLQNYDCTVKITGNVDNCKRCGKCRIKDLVELAEAEHVGLSVATGGTIARRIVVEKRPEIIIAVACERDLTSGIQDSYPVPVYGIFNIRPHGPCFNTQVDLKEVKEAMSYFLRDGLNVNVC